VNQAGKLTLTSGQSALAEQGKPPVSTVVVRPRDAVRWALYYQPTIHFRPQDFPAGPGWQGAVRNSLEAYIKGDLQAAFEATQGVPDTLNEPRFFVYRAALLLAVGRVEEASHDIDRALSLKPVDSDAFALRSIIAVTQNDRETALDLAKRAVTADPNSAGALIALSYAQQALFDLEDALASLKQAVQISPDNALAWARLAELHLSFADLDEALQAAQKAVTLDPNLSRTQTVLGYAYLTQVNTTESKKAFEQAIELDQGDPLPRLGLGLAKIRDSDLEEGRREIEIAVSLDPENALFRSYLGKAYFEEKRDAQASDQYKMAKQLDPKDPTPWLYDAILKQTENRPVEALQDLQKSIELNDNRAIYRSRLSLDADLAARGTALARIYDNLGFEQLALNEATKSLALDPANHSAHRFLSDGYLGQPRQEIARASELLQSQLLQPINIDPVQPSILETNLRILERIGPNTLGFNEFTSLFERNQMRLNLSITGGNNDTISDEAVVSGIYGPASFSAGQFYYDTDGFRPNNDLRHKIYNVFGQFALTPKINIQGEFRRRETKEGDLRLNFDPDNFSRENQRRLDQDTVRFGLRVTPSPRTTGIASLIYNDRKAKLKQAFHEPFDATIDERSDSRSYDAQGQFLFRGNRFNLIMGGGTSKTDIDNRETFTELGFPPDPPDENKFRVTQGNGYAYANSTYPKNIIWTFGLGYDFFDDETLKLNEFNPKGGLQWDITPRVRLRAAAFKTVKRLLINDLTLEPTQVAGFNQFFDDPNGTKAKRYGVGLDLRLTDSIYGGIETSRRDADVPVFRGPTVFFQDQREDLYRVYFYWTPHSQWAVSSEYRFEKIKSQGSGPRRVDTHSVPLAVRYFSPAGFFAELATTYVRQDVKLPSGTGFERDRDDFVLVDAAVGYRLPKRLGVFSLEVRNLFDQGFRFQDLNFINSQPIANPRFIPERTVLGRFTLNF
jgi:tetratricopeptide (TPR) repeat protein